MRALLFALALSSSLGPATGTASPTARSAAAHGRADAAAAADCRLACFKQKSQSYQRCRSIPPRDRDARERCFRAADAALEKCLGGCPR